MESCFIVGKRNCALSRAIYQCKNPEAASAPVYQSYETALEEITKMAGEQRLVFVIDEYPYLAKAEKSISSRLQALDYREMTAFHPQLPAKEQALLYGITGGIPHYINRLEVEDDLDEALLENLFHPAGYLFEEPENLLKQELREPALYNSIISAIAGGASRANEISTKVGLESGICAKYLRVLLELGILKKETPITERPGRGK